MSTPLPSDPLRMRHRMEELRREVNLLNRALLELVLSREELVREIMAIKRNLGLPTHDPEREQQMVDSLLGEMRGREHLESLFTELFRVSRALAEEPAER